MGYRKQLSITDRAVMDVVNKFPGLTPMQIATHLVGIVKESSVSGTTSRLISMGKVNRLKVRGSGTYTYFPLNHPLPQDRTQWDNALIAVPQGRQRKAAMPRSVTDPNNVHLQSVMGTVRPLALGPEQQLPLQLEPPAVPATPATSAPAPAPKTKAPVSDEAGVLLTIQYGNRQSLTVTMPEAKQIWEHLNVVFTYRLS